MPDGLPSQFWDQSAGQVNMGELIKAHTDLATFKQQHDERIAGLPQKADDYKVEWKAPDGFKAPDGLDVAALKINPDDPRVPALRQFAHEHKLTQDQVSGLVALHVQAQIAEFAAAQAEIQGEMKKLGENGPVRVKAAEDYLKANLGKDEYEAMRPFIGHSTAFAALEKLIAMATKQGVPPNGGGGGSPPRQERPRLADRFYGKASQ